MKTIGHKRIIKASIYMMCFAMLLSRAKAQHVDSAIVRLSLHEAIRSAKESNKLVGVLRTEESATQLDLRDGKMGALPRILSNASYQHYSKIRLYDGVLGESWQITKSPDANAGAVGVEASLNLYAGGKQQSFITDLKYKIELAALNSKEQESAIALQVVLHYLDLIRFYFQQQLIEDQIIRARTRSKNIEAFYANGKVTKSDVLRAEVLLSNALLSEISNKNDSRISNQKLNTLLNLNAFATIVPIDTDALILADTLEFEALLHDHSGAYALLKIQKNIELQENRTKLIRSSSHPSVSLFGGYGYNYPNTLVFPPKAQTVAVGMTGIRVSYDVSSLYQNKNKIKSARLRETELAQQKEWIADNVQQEARALSIKYHEALNRMLVVQKSIEQAETNYQIQSTKYFNQLGLLTDLLEADNLYQESRFNYIQANIAALSIYYRLLFVVGKL